MLARAMPSVTRVAAPGGWKAWRLEDQEAVVEVVPERGALVTRFALDGREILHLDESTLADPAQNVRGGIPVLFPMAGRLPGDVYRVDGREYRMKQHGFARNLPWTAVSTADGLSLRLESSAETRAVFPWDFAAVLRVGLLANVLGVVLRVENLSASAMPFHAGFHPYFRVDDAAKAATRVDTDALRAWDNVTQSVVEVGEPDFTVEELDLHLLDHHPPGTALHVPDRPPLRLEWRDPVRVMVLWTKRGKDFVCVEPWTGRAGALASGEPLPWIAPGASAELWLRIDGTVDEY